MSRRGEFKPYLFPDEPYMKISYSDSFQDFSAKNTDEHNEQYRPSEFHKPYKWPDSPGHPSWEWVWPIIPDIDPTCMELGNCPCIGDCNPDTCNPLVENCGGCTMDDTCHFCGVIGPGLVECGEKYIFTTSYFLEGCQILLDFLVVWKPGAGEMLGIGAYATWKAPDDCEPGEKFDICVGCPLGCNGCRTVTCTCCCECPEDGCELTGSDTVAPGGTWVGTLDPCCKSWSKPTIDSRIGNDDPSSTSGTISSDGCTVTVQVAADACGSFTVSLSDDCGNTASKEVRVTSGLWVSCSNSIIGCNVGYSCTSPGNCDFGYRAAPKDCTYNGNSCTAQTAVGVYLVQDCGSCCDPDHACDETNNTCSGPCCTFTSGGIADFGCPCDGAMWQDFTVFCTYIGSLNFWTCNYE